MSLNEKQARQLVAPFYDLLNQPSSKPIEARMKELTTDDWRSYAGETAVKTRAEFVGQVIGFGKLLPDLAWTIKEVLPSGDHRIVVRSEARGTPAGDFMGVPHGGRTFSVMTIDIHTLRDAKLALVHHVEDWAGALRQLSGK